MNNFVKLIISIVLCQLAGVIGSIAQTGESMAWFDALAKPSFNPPDWVFLPVWVTLYLLMGIGLFLVWREDLKNQNVKSAFNIFMVQLAVNAAWTWAFFGFRSTTAGLITIIILFILIILTVLRFLKVSKTAAYLLIPYLLWVAFAAFLNFSIWQLNK